MFSGIVAGTFKVRSCTNTNGIQRLVLDLSGATKNLEIGASVAVNGVCLTTIAVDDALVSFEVIQATLSQTNLRFLSPDDYVNVERSARLGDEIGGHLLSGHIADVVEVVQTRQSAVEPSISFVVPEEWRNYFFAKGYIALDGVSLTLASFNHESGVGVVNLIPETLRRTTLQNVKPGTLLNFEVDSTTVAVVDSIERLLESKRAVLNTKEHES